MHGSVPSCAVSSSSSLANTSVTLPRKDHSFRRFPFPCLDPHALAVAFQLSLSLWWFWVVLCAPCLSFAESVMLAASGSEPALESHCAVASPGSLPCCFCLSVLLSLFILLSTLPGLSGPDFISAEVKTRRHILRAVEKAENYGQGPCLSQGKYALFCPSSSVRSSPLFHSAHDSHFHVLPVSLHFLFS